MPQALETALLAASAIAASIRDSIFGLRFPAAAPHRLFQAVVPGTRSFLDKVVHSGKTRREQRLPRRRGLSSLDCKVDFMQLFQRHLPAFGFAVLLLAISVVVRADEPKPVKETPSPNKKVSPEHAKRMAAGLGLFKKQVRSILVSRCLKCHGGKDVQGEFDLRTRKDLLKGGGEGVAVVPGKSGGSRLMRLLEHKEQPHMPYEEKKLPVLEISAIKRWIDLGAPYDSPLVTTKAVAKSWTERKIDPSARQWWAFRPLRVVDPPAVKTKKWGETDVDRFVLAKLEQNGLTPNTRASKRKLIRRAFFDLIGLPPSPGEVAQFLNDSSPRAFANTIDRLLKSEHYGERWGRHWLDVARFGESFGFEQDYDRPHAYHFRDFVIKAMNQDMPYDQFIRWQLAGDEFAPENPLAMMATGFLGAGVFPTQLTEKEFESARYDELDDMVSTMGTSMLGITIGCARCHDHKFDPIPQADYYRMITSFGRTIRSNIDLDLDPQGYKRAKQVWQREHEPLAAALKTYEDGELAKKLDARIADSSKLKAPEARWKTLDLISFKSTKSDKVTMKKLDDGSILVTGDTPNQDQYQFVAETRMRNITAVRLDCLTHPTMKKNGPGRATNGNFALTEMKVHVRPFGDPKAKPVQVKMVAARATHEQNQDQLAVKGVIDDGYASGWAVDGGGIGKDQSAAFDFEKPIDFEGGVRITFNFTFGNNVQHSIGRPRLSITSDAAPVAIEGDRINQHVADALAVLKNGGKSNDLNQTQSKSLRRWFFEQDGKWEKLYAAVDDHSKKEPQPKTTKVMVTSEGFKPIPNHGDGRGFPHFYEQTYFLRRGDANQKEREASQGFLQVLMRSEQTEKRWQTAPPTDWRTTYRRRSLANWITDTEHGAGHLLARVIVNRLWQHHLGRGIVATPNDFGVQGQKPTHPELIDWLAAKLIAEGWRLKPIHKLIMTSAVYMQSAKFDEADSAKDPDNRWYWRRDPRRLEAEIIRDSMLSVSGQLDATMFGPGTLDQKMKRRSIYFFIKRSRLVSMMQIFDAPEPLVSVGNRPSTTIAPQALMFMNNPQVREYARSFANSLLPESKKSLADAVRKGYLTAVAREPSETELSDTVAFIKSQIASYDSDKTANSRELALADFCQILMSLNEFIYVE